MRVNGEPGELNTFVEEGDTVELDGQPLAPQRLAYVLLHKPAGSSRPRATRRAGRPSSISSRTSRASSRSAGSTPTRPAPSCSTNDGELAHRLAHPRYEVEKVYEAEVEGEPVRRGAPPARRRDRARRRPHCTRPTSAASARHASSSSIHEGRKHQVKRMLEAVGHPVRRLHRSRYAGLTPTGLAPGEWRELTGEEVEALRELTRRT